jgi:hypothetical protein
VNHRKTYFKYYADLPRYAANHLYHEINGKAANDGQETVFFYFD